MWQQFNLYLGEVGKSGVKFLLGRYIPTKITKISRFSRSYSKRYKRVSYRKQMASQHSWSTVKIFSSHLIWSPFKIWLLFLILCARMQDVPKILRDAGASPLRGIRQSWLPPRNMLLPHVCYRTKFGRCRPNRLGVGRGSIKFWGRWGPAPWIVTVTIETRSGPTYVTIPTFVSLGHTVWEYGAGA